MSVNPERVRVIQEMYGKVIRRPIEYLRERTLQGGTLLDVGTGDAILAVEVLKDLKVPKAVFSDNVARDRVEIPGNATFEMLDACGDDLLPRFRNKVTHVTCFTALHEFEDPHKGVFNLVSVLPHSGVLLLFDYTERGLARQEAVCAREGAASMRHHEEDLRRTKRFGLDTDQGIKRFWESWFSRSPGASVFQSVGDLYSVLYIARNWGEVKAFPT